MQGHIECRLDACAESLKCTCQHCIQHDLVCPYRLGFRRGLLLVESPRSNLPAAASHIEQVAAAVSALPQLSRRCNLGSAGQAATEPGVSDGAGWASILRGVGGAGAHTLRSLPSIGDQISGSQGGTGAVAVINEGTADAVSADLVSGRVHNCSPALDVLAVHAIALLCHM